MSKKSKPKKKGSSPKRKGSAEDERDPKFLEGPPVAPPAPGVPPSEAPQIDEDTEIEPDKP